MKKAVTTTIYVCDACKKEKEAGMHHIYDDASKDKSTQENGIDLCNNCFSIVVTRGLDGITLLTSCKECNGTGAVLGLSSKFNPCPKCQTWLKEYEDKKVLIE